MALFLRSADHAFTFIEVLVVIAVASILIVGLAVFMGRAFKLPREYSAQFRITEDARVQLARMSDAIRNSRNLDCGGGSGKSWLQFSGPYEISVITNVTNSTGSQLVRYFVDPASANTLKRQVIELSPTDVCNLAGVNTTESVLLTSLRNSFQQKPIFTYLRADGQVAAKLVDTVSVHIKLMIDNTEQQYPGALEIETAVNPRSVLCQGATCPDVAPSSACSFNNQAEQVSTNHNYSLNDFADDAFSQCRQYCGNASDNQCCSWGVGFYWDGQSSGDVMSVCNCQSQPMVIPSLSPSPLMPTPILAGGSSYTEYYRQCWDGTLCGRDDSSQPYVGTVYCAPACLDASQPNPTPGQCACQCPLKPDDIPY